MSVPEQDESKHVSFDPNEEAMARRLTALKSHLDSVDKRDRKVAEAAQPAFNRGQAIGRALRLGTEFIAGIAVGGFIGFWIDKLAGTWPIAFAIFFLLGIAAGFVNVFRTAREIQEEQSEAVKRGALDLPDEPDED